MQYLALLYTTEEARPKPGSPEFEASLDKYGHANRTFKATGAWIDAAPLQPVETAKSIRVRDDKIIVTDGPFAETKERLGGYYLLECRDLDHAIDLVKLIPMVEFGTIELRPIMDVPIPDA